MKKAKNIKDLKQKQVQIIEEAGQKQIKGGTNIVVVDIIFQ